MNAIDEMACATPGCDNRGKPGLNIVGYGSFATKSGRRRRYRCTVCRGTLSTNTGTAYSGLRCTRREFDQVASLRVEGVSISATARVTGHSRNTVARWLERASTAAKHFNDRMLRDFDLIELQADELCTFIGNKSTTVWLFATIEVSSRVWASSVLGRRSDRNARAVIDDVICRGRVVGCPLIATDGFEYYVGAVGALLGSTCVYGQVLKTRRNNRVVRVERRVKIGTANRLKAALWASEDSETLNTSFVERLNLTIRQASAYLRRRSPCHARDADQLRSHVELVRCHYNFVRPHRALRFGRETRTPAMQACRGRIQSGAGHSTRPPHSTRRKAPMPDRDPLPEFCRYSLWKEYEGVAMHFNDLLLRLRSQSLAAVAAFAAIASAILRNSNESAPLWGALTGVFGLLILFWIAIWVLDLGYYNRLLLGAVQALISIEKDSAGSGTVDKIILSTEIDKMVVMKEADFQSVTKGNHVGSLGLLHHRDSRPKCGNGGISMAVVVNRTRFSNGSTVAMTRWGSIWRARGRVAHLAAFFGRAARAAALTTHQIRQYQYHDRPR